MDFQLEVDFFRNQKKCFETQLTKIHYGDVSDNGDYCLSLIIRLLCYPYSTLPRLKSHWYKWQSTSTAHRFQVSQVHFSSTRKRGPPYITEGLYAPLYWHRPVIISPRTITSSDHHSIWKFIRHAPKFRRYRILHHLLIITRNSLKKRFYLGTWAKNSIRWLITSVQKFR